MRHSKKHNPHWQVRLANPAQRCIELQGKVKWFSDSHGYGYIERDDGPDVFVYYTAILCAGLRTLKAGDSVRFEIVQKPEGPQALNVSLTSTRK